MKILGTGLKGLVGSKIVELLKDSYEFQNISRSEGIDITNENQIIDAIVSTDAEVILHMAAKTNVDGCEADKIKGKDGEAWQINVEGTRNIANAAERVNKKIIYISTDFVFDGEEDCYTEIDSPNPINWYGQTKCEGENVVQSISSPWLIVRIAYPYRASFQKNDFMRAMKERLEQNLPILGVSDHIFCPTYVDDIASALDMLIKKNETGIFHVVGSEAISPYNAAQMIAEEFALNASLISSTTREVYFKDKAQRPFRLHLKSDKIEALGISIRSFKEGLGEIKKQIQKVAS